MPSVMLPHEAIVPQGHPGRIGREDDPPMISVRDLHKVYRSGQEQVEALRGVTFEVERGVCQFLVGPSGSGKSTLLYLLGALDEPTSGSITIDGAELTR